MPGEPLGSRPQHPEDRGIIQVHGLAQALDRLRRRRLAEQDRGGVARQQRRGKEHDEGHDDRGDQCDDQPTKDK